jgi:GAF domain-containing protein
MIRHRLADLDRAVGRAIEVLRAAKHAEEVAQPVLELLAQAACSERATYWTVDAEVRLRSIASWSALGPTAGTREGEARHRATWLSQGNAGHVWRSRKPLWATSFVLDTTQPGSLGPGLRAGVWFAVKSDTSVYGVIELLGRALESKTPDNLAIVERLGVRLGHTLEELRHGRRGGARLH